MSFQLAPATEYIKNISRLPAKHTFFQLALTTECIELLATHFANLGLFNSHSLRSVSNLAEIFETHCDLSTRTHYGVYLPSICGIVGLAIFQLALTTERILLFL